MKNLAWLALILAAICVGVLSAGCGSDGCCWGCSCPAGLGGQVTPMNGDGGAADATGEQ